MTRTLRRTLLRNWNHLLGSLLRRNADRDLAEELDSHIGLLAEEDIRRGIPPEKAHRRTKIDIGPRQRAAATFSGSIRYSTSGLPDR
jgi:hypothetical protein